MPDLPIPSTPEPPGTTRRSLAVWTLAALGAGAIGAAGWRLYRDQPFAPGPKQLPALDYPIIDGRRIGPQDLAGRVTLVQFWATTCAVCVAEMPELMALHARYRDRGFELLAIAMPYDRPDRVLEFARRRALPFPVALDPMGAAVAAWGGVQGTPATWLVGPDGRIRAHWLGAPNLSAVSARIEALLATRSG